MAAVKKCKTKSDYCWNFNKGLKCRYGNHCRFIERCSCCDAVLHPVIECPKASDKEKEAAVSTGK